MSSIIFRPIVRRTNPFFNYAPGSVITTQAEQNTNEPKLVNSPVFANILEKSDKYILEVALPGFTKDEVKIEQHENKITVSGNKNLHQDGKIHRKEFEISSFERVFVLPAEVQSDKIEATFQNGILTLIVLKTEAKAPKIISVK